MKLLYLIPLLLVSCGVDSPPNQFHPMVDGKNTEYQKLGAIPQSLSEEVNLYIYQNASYVWISYDYPKGSFGTLDMIIKTDKIPDPLNLHVSVQLGEWPVGNEEKKPKTATSELWWNIKGWTANNLWVNGIDTLSYDTPEFKIRNGEIREIQLAKERFGKGKWNIKLKINAIKNNEGEFVSIEFPNEDSYHSIQVD